MRTGSNRVPVGLAEKRSPARRDHDVEPFRLGSAVGLGLVSGSMIFNSSMIEPGQPCVMMTGRAP